MPEWWTYGLSDFLLFSPRTYYRLLQHYNEAIWPAQVFTLGLGVWILLLLRRPSPRLSRITAAILAALWAWIGWSFLRQRYATINWVVNYAVPLFALEALLIGWDAGVRRRVIYRPHRDVAGVVGMSLLVFSLALYPLMSALSGRPWRQAEVFGITPDPTALGTLGLLMLTERPWSLMVVPMLWCLLSGVTLLAMGSPEAWIQLPAPFVAAGAIAWYGRQQKIAS
jgi:hypothetical protein